MSKFKRGTVKKYSPSSTTSLPAEMAHAMPVDYVTDGIYLTSTSVKPFLHDRIFFDKFHMSNVF